jgi:hypothetical protein
MAAASAPVTPDRDQQGGGTPPERLVRQPPGHGVTRRAFASAATAPLIRLNDPTSNQCTVGFEPLSDGFEAKLVQSTEGGQVSA